MLYLTKIIHKFKSNIIKDNLNGRKITSYRYLITNNFTKEF